MADEALVHVATYARTVPASLQRVWENVFDWEHLPWLHRGSFSAIECTEAGDWGWRARIGLQPEERGGEILLELCVERGASRYVSRTLEGPGRRTEIWTSLQADGDERTGVEVSFHVPGVDPQREAEVGARFTALYTRLWDEDEAMMTLRSDRLARPPAPASPGGRLRLGAIDELRRRLPESLDFGGRRWRIVELDGGFAAHTTTCPHMLGPLEHAGLEDGCIRCPWHGYRFDLRTGRNTDGGPLRLPRAPRIEVDDTGTAWLVPVSGRGGGRARGR